jgi:hypothetical protein
VRKIVGGSEYVIEKKIDALIIDSVPIENCWFDNYQSLSNAIRKKLMMNFIKPFLML